MCHVKNQAAAGSCGAGGHGLSGAWDQSRPTGTAWDLIAVEKGAALINMDTQAPRTFCPVDHQQEPESPSTRSAVAGTPGWTSVWSGRRAALVEVKGRGTLGRRARLFQDAPRAWRLGIS